MIKRPRESFVGKATLEMGLEGCVGVSYDGGKQERTQVTTAHSS